MNAPVFLTELRALMVKHGINHLKTYDGYCCGFGPWGEGLVVFSRIFADPPETDSNGRTTDLTPWVLADGSLAIQPANGMSTPNKFMFHDMFKHQ